MKETRLKTIKDPYFKNAWALYEDAFPVEERRLIDEQEEMMKHQQYHVNIILDDSEFIGILFWWEFDDLNYIEHFATSPNQRNKGYGNSILQNFIQNNPKPILLEAELPDSAINKRRLNFYQRIGFHLNDIPYSLPPIRLDMPPIELLILTYPKEVSHNTVDDFLKNEHPINIDLKRLRSC